MLLRLIKIGYVKKIELMASDYPAFSLRLFSKELAGIFDLYDAPLSTLKALASTSKTELEKMQDDYNAMIRAMNEAVKRTELRKKEEEEAARREQESRQKEIAGQFDGLQKRFPNGMRIYQKQHPTVTDKETLITVPTRLLQEYEENFHIAQYYSDWHNAQAQFAKDVRALRNTKLDNWGCSCYNASIRGYNENGGPQEYEFMICQIFCESFCASQNADYTHFPKCKANYKNITEFKQMRRKFNNWVYDKIVEFIQAIPGSPLVNFTDSGLGEYWSQIEDYHFGYLQQRLRENDTPFVSVAHLPLSDNLHCGPVVFIELISNNQRLKENCSHFLQSSSGNNLTVVYISLLKEYDEAEFTELNHRKEKEIREAEEKKKYEQEERERKEREEAEHREQEEKERKARERQELLYRVSHATKLNASAFINHLTSNGIRYFYHFTDRRNLDSIRRNGGLFSWKYCEDNGIEIPFPGGDGPSRSLDTRHGLADYVRLSFCNDHPMRYHVDQRGGDTVLLRIKLDVAGLEGTLFSDINAADTGHHHGGTLNDLRRVNLAATQQTFVRNDSEIFKQHQAEVMVKTFIPLEYIVFPENFIDSWDSFRSQLSRFPPPAPARPSRDYDPSDDLPF